MKITQRQQHVLPEKKYMRNVPSTSGVYMFLKKGVPLYIGKSANLKARLMSHFENAAIDPKEFAITSGCDRVTYSITDCEFKAILLEAELIQKHQPKYNTIWKDDKSYLYIKIDQNLEFPKIYPVRKEHEAQCLYFGPFSSLKKVEVLIREIRKVFPFCMQKKIGKTPCFYSKIGLCSPCPNVIAQSKDKTERLRLMRLYRANTRQVIRVLKGNLTTVLKDLYKKMKTFTQRKEYEEALTIRNKIAIFEQLMTHQLQIDQSYHHTNTEENLNALFMLLKEYFPPIKTLERIECYDVSSLAFKQATASMVVATSGFLNKDQYRRFRIQSKNLRSDFEMLQEVFQRRFANTWEHPDLIVVDGGKPQVKTVQTILNSLNITIPLIGIAKNPDRLIMGDAYFSTIRPSFSHKGFNLIRLMRDESHRFAKKYHLVLRSRELV